MCSHGETVATTSIRVQAACEVDSVEYYIHITYIRRGHFSICKTELVKLEVTAAKNKKNKRITARPICRIQSMMRLICCFGHTQVKKGTIIERSYRNIRQ